MLKRFIGVIFLFPIFVFSKGDFKPKLDYSLQDKYLLHKKSPFAPLTGDEEASLWGKECYIGKQFAKSLDLYQAITSFKRANILIPDKEIDRKREIEYHILFAYYLAKKYQDVVDTFESSLLASTDGTFGAYHDLLVILYDSYTKTDEFDKAKFVYRLLEKTYPQASKKLELSQAILTANFDSIRKLSNHAITKTEIETLLAKKGEESQQVLLTSGLEKEESFNEIHVLEDYMDCQKSAQKILKEFTDHKKSPMLAQLLNAALPGSGYLYLGQKQTAFTAFCVNSLFIGSMVYFFSRGNLPAGILATSFELGWYFGGIIGAKENAILYNERLFEEKAHYRLRDHKLYPALALHYGF